jgi:hypothetical protein
LSRSELIPAANIDGADRAGIQGCIVESSIITTPRVLRKTAAFHGLVLLVREKEPLLHQRELRPGPKPGGVVAGVVRAFSVIAVKPVES